MAGSFPMLAAYDAKLSISQRDELYRQSTQSGSVEGSDFKSRTVDDPDVEIQDRGRSRGISKSHRRLVFTDPVAFRYLEEDASTTVLARRHKLEGYELYVVEQWVVSRTHPTFTICTHTGDTNHSILVNVLAVPQDQSTWSERLKIYFNAVSQSYAREKDTQLGTLMVTNLSGFPSALNVIPVPDGDVKKHREDFMVNEDLKRMGCAGRAAMSLQYPQASTINKFHHMYRTSEKVPLYSSVTEIVRFCQLSLALYGKLESVYADGLLCDITEKAITQWWNEIGLDFHNVEPSDGILGPTTVSALIGLVIGAYNRLRETGQPVGKEPLDLPSMKQAIGSFQKQQKIARTRRLDRATLDRLHRVTANKVEDDGLAVTRALKSTVAGISGKGGEMIARGFGGGREKAGIAEVETLDIDRLAQLVTGRNMKWLWQGKNKGSSASATAVPTDELNGRVFSTDDQGNFIWTGRTNDRADDFPSAESADTDERKIRGSRLRGAVGLTKDHGGRAQTTDDEGGKEDRLALPSAIRDLRSDPHSHRSSRSTTTAEFPPLTQDLARASIAAPKREYGKIGDSEIASNRDRSGTALSSHRQALRGLDHQGRESPSKRRMQEALSAVRQELEEPQFRNFSTMFSFSKPKVRALRRSSSAIQLRSVLESRRAKLPRHLSFSIVSDAIERGNNQEEDSASESDGDYQAESDRAGVTRRPIAAQIKIRKEQLRQSQDLAAKIYGLDRGIVPFAEARIEKVVYIEEQGQEQLEQLNNLYYQHLEEYQTLQATSTDLVAREKTSLSEAMRRIDVLGQKLDYEIVELQSRMQEVEDSVDDFERRVLDIEASVQTLIMQDEKPRNPAWYERWFGLGRPKQGVPQVAEDLVSEKLDKVIDEPVLPSLGTT